MSNITYCSINNVAVQFIAADLVLIIVLAPLMTPSLPMFTDPSHTSVSSSYTGYRVILPVFASVSLATDITITGIMFWFVRDSSSVQPLPLLTPPLS